MLNQSSCRAHTAQPSTASCVDHPVGGGGSFTVLKQSCSRKRADAKDLMHLNDGLAEAADTNRLLLLLLTVCTRVCVCVCDCVCVCETVVEQSRSAVVPFN